MSTTTTTPMPGPSERRAPRFEGEGRTLLQFLEHYNTVAKAAGLADKDKILRITAYMTSGPRDLVEGYDEYRKADDTSKWETFVDRMKLDYYDCEKPKEYKRNDYDNFKAKALAMAITDVKTLVEFTREFRRYASDVIRSGDLSEKQAQRHYYAILVKVLGTTLESRLTALDASKRAGEWTFAEVLSKAKEVIEDLEIDSQDFRQALKTPAASSPAPLSTEFAPQTKVEVKKEDFASILAQISTRMENIEKSMRASSKNGASQTNSGNQAQSTTQQSGSPSASTFPKPEYRCYYDGCAKRFNECDRLIADLASGFAKRENGKIVYPDGTAIYGGPGVKLCEKIAEWYKAHPDVKQPGTATQGSGIASMLVDIGETFFAGAKMPQVRVIPPTPEYESRLEPTFASKEAEAEWRAAMYDDVFAQEQADAFAGKQDGRYPLRNRERATSGSAKEQDKSNKERAPHLDAKIDKIPSKSKDADPAPGSAKPATRSVPPASIEEVPDDSLRAKGANRVEPPTPATFNPVPVSARALPPSYRHQAPIENDGLTKVVNERILESRVPLTVQELLALCPSLRRHFKDQITGKRVAAGLADDQDESADVMIFRAYQDHDASRDLIVADFTASLRYLDCRVGDFIAEGIIDNGSQIVVISQRFWEAVRQPLDNKLKTSMTAANGSTGSTMGVCVNLPVNIAGITFYVQAHVVEEAPFSLLLGRPFLVLAAAEEVNRRDGSSILTLSDPNMPPRSVSIATRNRSTRPPPRHLHPHHHNHDEDF